MGMPDKVKYFARYYLAVGQLPGHTINSIPALFSDAYAAPNNQRVYHLWHLDNCWTNYCTQQGEVHVTIALGRRLCPFPDYWYRAMIVCGVLCTVTLTSV